MSVFVNSPDVAKMHPEAFVIAAGGILFEIDKFVIGGVFRQSLTEGIITNITDKSFTMKFDDGYSITYPLPYEITSLKHLNVSEEDMYRYEFWVSHKPLKPRKMNIIQLSIFDLVSE